MRAEEIQAALLYTGALTIFWTYWRGFAEIRAFAGKLGRLRHRWLDICLIILFLSMFAWPFVPGALLDEYGFGRRWHISVLTLFVAMVASFALSFVTLTIVAVFVPLDPHDDIKSGLRVHSAALWFLLLSVGASIWLWGGTLDQLRD